MFKTIKEALKMMALGAVWARFEREVGVCGARNWERRLVGPFEVTLTVRDVRLPDAYSREELREMLLRVRSYEAESGWLVPEPKPEELPKRDYGLS